MQNEIELKIQVGKDLQTQISRYPSQKEGLKKLTKQTGLTSKTIQRLLKMENRPGYSTLFKIYRAIHQTQNDSALINLVPKIVKEEILKKNPLFQEQKVNHQISFHNDIEVLIQQNPCFAEIYFICAAGIINHDFIKSRFGEFGVETLCQMLEIKVIKEVSHQKYTLGNTQTHIGPETMKRVGLNVLNKYFRTQSSELGGENLIAFYTEGLSLETYQQWLKIDENAFHQKMELANKAGAKGDIKAFTFMAIDQIK